MSEDRNNGFGPITGDLIILALAAIFIVGMFAFGAFGSMGFWAGIATNPVMLLLIVVPLFFRRWWVALLISMATGIVLYLLFEAGCLGYDPKHYCQGRSAREDFAYLMAYVGTAIVVSAAVHAASAALRR